VGKLRSRGPRRGAERVSLLQQQPGNDVDPKGTIPFSAQTAGSNVVAEFPYLNDALHAFQNYADMANTAGPTVATVEWGVMTNQGRYFLVQGMAREIPHLQIGNAIIEGAQALAHSHLNESSFPSLTGVT